MGAAGAAEPPAQVARSAGALADVQNTAGTSRISVPGQPVEALAGLHLFGFSYRYSNLYGIQLIPAVHTQHRSPHPRCEAAAPLPRRMFLQGLAALLAGAGLPAGPALARGLRAGEPRPCAS